jgi:hypothetical protein
VSPRVSNLLNRVRQAGRRGATPISRRIGQADFASTRAFDLNFAGGFASLGAAAASLAAPINSGLAQGVGNLFQVGDLANLGDATFMGPGVTVYALKGDAEIQLQILDVSDAGIPDKTIQLAKIILGRL